MCSVTIFQTIGLKMRYPLTAIGILIVVSLVAINAYIAVSYAVTFAQTGLDAIILPLCALAAVVFKAFAIVIIETKIRARRYLSSILGTALTVVCVMFSMSATLSSDIIPTNDLGLPVRLIVIAGILIVEVFLVLGPLLIWRSMQGSRR